MNLVKVPCVSINPTYLAVYDRWFVEDQNGVLIPKPRKMSDMSEEEREAAKKNLRNNKTKGVISKKASARMKKAISWFIYQYEPYLMVKKHQDAKKITFVTLTLPSQQVHSDQEIKRVCINQLVIELKKKFQIKSYIWKAEKQKNGNIHFHFLLPVNIPHKELRDIWNRILDKLGYVGRYADKMRRLSYGEYAKKYGYGRNKRDIRRSYNVGCSTGWMSPNTTDIKRVKKARNVVNYIAGYFSSKQKDGSKPVQVEGRLWYCSKDISQIKDNWVMLDDYIGADLYKLEKKAIKTDFCVIYPVRLGFILGSCKWIRRAFEVVREGIEKGISAEILERRYLNYTGL